MATTLRSDASRNRERLLAAARELFAERGLHVTMDEIAKAAGVGVGTAYRRFRNRDELIAALFEERIREFVAGAEEAAALERVADARDRLWPLVEGLVRRAQEAGRLRGDIAVSDLPVVNLMLREVVDFSYDVAPDLWRRYLALVLDGLRGERSPLPQPPLAPDELEAAMGCHQPRRR